MLIWSWDGYISKESQLTSIKLFSLLVNVIYGEYIIKDNTRSSSSHVEDDPRMNVQVIIKVENYVMRVTRCRDAIIRTLIL